MFKFGVILLASYACAASLPPCPKTGTDLKTPPFPGHCNPHPIVAQKVPQLPNQFPCQCVEDKKPVCGTDGKTYPNLCSLNCERAKHPALKKDHDGQCSVVPQKVPQLPNQSPCQCTEDKKLVCGTDGKTYPNLCSLNCERAKHPALKKDHDGQCSVVPQKVPQLPNQSPCQCTEDKKPVCGTDGKTYPNLCSLNCERAKHPALKKDHDGQCSVVPQKVPQLPNQSPCQCTEDKKPVCGTDGKTYPNQCSLNCERAKHPALKKDHDAQCSVVPQKVPQLPNQSPCQCVEDKKPVCGTDGKTYPNQCSLNCERAKHPALKKDHDGQCSVVPQKVPQLPNQSPCQCTEDKKPVCGTDGKTYPNLCSLNCERAKQPALKKDHDGQCSVVPQKVPQLPNQSPCQCTEDKKPVCGTDGKTYPNQCSLNCERAKNPALKKDHDGQCKVPETGIKSKS